MHLNSEQKKASQLILRIALHSYTLKKEMYKAVHFACSMLPLTWSLLLACEQISMWFSDCKLPLVRSEVHVGWQVFHQHHETAHNLQYHWHIFEDKDNRSKKVEHVASICLNSPVAVTCTSWLLHQWNEQVALGTLVTDRQEYIIMLLHFVSQHYIRITSVFC